MITIGTMTTRFEEVPLYGEKSGKCLCGKRRTRRKKFSMTLNPWNRGPDGIPGTRDEIRVELVKLLKKWQEQPIYCDQCEPPERSE